MNKKILIVDDQEGIRFLLEEIVRSEGYLASGYENGVEVIEEIEKNRPDLLIIDYHLPVKNGAEVIKELEAKGYSVPTIVMSGLIDDVKKETPNLQSIKAYFSKPFDILEAKEQINQLLNP